MSAAPEGEESLLQAPVRVDFRSPWLPTPGAGVGRRTTLRKGAVFVSSCCMDVGPWGVEGSEWQTHVLVTNERSWILLQLWSLEVRG